MWKVQLSFKDNIELVKMLSPKLAVKKILKRAKLVFKRKYKLISSKFYPTFRNHSFKPDNLNEISELLAEIYQNLKIDIWLSNSDNNKMMLNLGEKYINHRFSLLGSGWTEINHAADYNGMLGVLYDTKLDYKDKSDFVGKYINNKNRKYSQSIIEKLPEKYRLIDWQRDYRSGYRWSEKDLSINIQIGRIAGADIKQPWELGRMQHLLVIFYCWKLTGENKYIDKFQNQIMDFVSSNPPGFGVQWYNAMEPSIRCVNWIFVYSLFKINNAQFNTDFEDIFINSVAEHLFFIKNNLEWSDGLRANHYFANISGLLLISLFLGLNDNRIYEILEFAKMEILNEINYQFLDDGGNFEKSLPYHYFVLEMMIYTLLILKKNSMLEEKSNFQNRIEKIINFSYNHLNGKNQIPIYGDLDSGYFFRFVPPYNLKNEDYEFYLDDYSELLRLIDMFYFANNYSFNENEIVSFPDFGSYLFKNKNYRLNLFCGDFKDESKGGHIHNDNLSFTLDVGDDKFIIDTGTFNYTAFPELRNKFRSVKMHNTLQLEDMEQNEIIHGSGGNLFWMKRKGKGRISNITNNEITAEHNFNKVNYQRKIEFRESEIIFTDTCLSDGKKYLRLFLNPEIKSVITIDNIVKIDYKSKLADIIFANEIPKIEKSEISPNYGELIETNLILVETKNTIIEWKIIIR